ncbi:hypothetical protein KC571_01300, partial [candidate division WWE3 bacterium]|nr:hypothetical protein [candidate division WWE3 bacterium]
MKMEQIEITQLDTLKPILEKVCQDESGNEAVSYIDIRLAASEGIGAYTEDGMPKVTSKDWGFSLGVRVISGSTLKAAGYFGRSLGIPD